MTQMKELEVLFNSINFKHVTTLILTTKKERKEEKKNIILKFSSTNYQGFTTTCNINVLYVMHESVKEKLKRQEKNYVALYLKPPVCKKEESHGHGVV